MTGLTFALALLMGFTPAAPQPPPQEPVAVSESAPVTTAPTAEPVPTPVVGGEETAGPTSAVVPVPLGSSPPPSLPDVEFDDDEQRVEVGGWPSPLYRCPDGGVTDAAQLASLTGRTVDEVTTALEQNCTRL